MPKTTVRTTKPRSEVRRGTARAGVALGLALAMALVGCTAPPVPVAPGDVPDGSRIARSVADTLLAFAAYNYGLAGTLTGQLGRIVFQERYAAVARSLARSLLAQNSATVVASASAAGPVRDRLIPLADSLTDVARAANAYANGREPSAFARVAAAVGVSWDRLRELMSVLPPDDVLVKALGRGSQIVVTAREETRSVLTVGPYLTRGEADTAAKSIGQVERVEGGPPFVLRVASFASRTAADAAGAALAVKKITGLLVVDEARWFFMRAGPIPDAELWREPVRVIESVAGTRRVSLSSDGAWLATGADDGTIAIFTGDGALRALPRLRAGVAHLVFSDDGKQLLGGGVNLQIFAVPQGTTLGTLDLTSPATAVLFAPAPASRAFVAASRGPTGVPGGGAGAVNARAPDGVVLGAPFPIVTPAAGAVIATSQAGDLYVATPTSGGVTTDIEVLRLGFERVLRPVARVPGAARTLTIDRSGTAGAILTDQGVYRFAPTGPALTQNRVLGPVRDIAYGTDGILYALDARALTALDRSGAVLWTAPLTDGRRLLTAARTLVLDGPDRLLVFGPNGAVDDLGVDGPVQDVAMSLSGRRIAVVVEARRALLFELP